MKTLVRALLLAVFCSLLYPTLHAQSASYGPGGNLHTYTNNTGYSVSLRWANSWSWHMSNGSDGYGSNSGDVTLAPGASFDYGPYTFTDAGPDGYVIDGTGTTWVDDVSIISPPPTASISASQSSVPSGGWPVTINWSTSNATSATISGPGLSSVALSGAQSVSIAANTSTTTARIDTFTITATGPGGTTTSSCTVSVDKKQQDPISVNFNFGNLSHVYDGSMKTATVTCTDSSATYTADLTKGPNVGSYAVSATANGNYSGNGNATLTISQRQRTLNVSGPTSGIVGQTYGYSASVSAGGGAINWGNGASGSSANYSWGSPGTYTVSATCVGDQNDSSASGSVSVTISAAATTTYTLSTSVSPAGAGSISGGGTYNAGSTANVSASANSGYQFNGFSGTDSSSGNTGSVTMNSDRSVTANFSTVSNPPPSASISASPASGTAPLNTTISWSTGNATSVNVSGPGLSSSATSGSQAVNNLAAGTYAYTIQATNSGGTTTQTATVTVSASGGSLPTASITASPATGTEPMSTSIAWTTSGATTVDVSGPGLSSPATTGMQPVTGLAAGTYTYTLHAVNASGTTTKTATVTVASASALATITLPALPTVSGLGSTTPVNILLHIQSPTMASVGISLVNPQGAVVYPAVWWVYQGNYNTCQFAGQGNGWVLSSNIDAVYQVTIPPFTAAGQYKLVVTANNSAGNQRAEGIGLSQMSAIVRAYFAVDGDYPQGSDPDTGDPIDLVPGDFGWSISPSYLEVQQGSTATLSVSPGSSAYRFERWEDNNRNIISYALSTPITASQTYNNFIAMMTASDAPVPITFTASPLTFVYDGSVKVPTVTTPGFPGLPYNYSGTLSAINVGTYSFTVFANPYTNYSGTQSFNWTITPAPQTVAISPTVQTVAPGESINFTATGGQSYTWGGTSGATGSGATKAVTFATPGTYTVTVQAAASGNYDASNTATATITVTAIPVTPTFGNLSHSYDGTTKTATVTFPGYDLVPGVDFDADLTKGPAAGSYTITATAKGKYFGSGSATLTIAKATPTISWTTPAAITYGTALSATQLNATASTPGAFVYTPAAGTVLAAGSQTLGVTFTPTDSANYNNASATTTLTVNKATPTISWVTPAAITYGTALSATQLNATANVPGTLTYSPVAGTVLGAGSQTLSVTFTPTDSANYNGASATTTLTVNKATPTISWATPAAITYGTALSGTQLNATASVPGAFVYAPAAGTVLGVGNPILNATFTPTDTANYNNASAITTLTVNPAILTGTVTAASKTYDGNTSATITGRSLSGVLGADNVTLSSGTANFADKTVGPNKTVTVTGLVLVGADAGKYQLASTTVTTIASITAQPLTATGVTAATRVYDGTTVATLSFGGAALVGVVSGDTVTLSTGAAVGTFASKTVGAGKIVTIAGLALAGADAGNYTLTQPTTTASITTKTLTIGGVVANNKTYDGNTAASLNSGGASLVGVVSGDTVTLNAGGATGAFADKSVGVGKAVTISGYTISGADSANYTLMQPSATASITAKNLVVAGQAANDKVYDGGTGATLNWSGASLVGVVAGDTVTLVTGGAAGAFGNKVVGSGKTVTIAGLALGGPDAGNYLLTQPTATASITLKNLTVSGVSAANKVFDGGLNATLNLSSATLVGVIAGDLVTLNASAAVGTFNSIHVGTAKAVTIAGLALGGPDAGNYALTQPSTAADITPAPQTVVISPTGPTVVQGASALFTATGGQNAYVWGGTAGITGAGTTQTLAVAANAPVGTVTVTVFSQAGGDYQQSNIATATVQIIAAGLVNSFTPLVSNYTVHDPNSPMDGKTYGRMWQTGSDWQAYLGRSGVQFEANVQGWPAVQALQLQCKQPGGTWVDLAVVTPSTSGVTVDQIFSVRLGEVVADQPLVPLSYQQGAPLTGDWYFRVRSQNTMGAWSDWSNEVKVNVVLPLVTKTTSGKTVPPPGPLGDWFTESTVGNYTIKMWIP
jgi:trimeric autotransporter adhesin